MSEEISRRNTNKEYIENIDYIYIDDGEKLDICVKYLKESRLLAVDTETTGLDPNKDKIRLLQVAVPGKPAAVIDMKHLKESDLAKIKNIFHNDSVKIFQNAKFDIKFLLASEFNIKGPIFDTMLAAQIVWDNNGPKSFSLESLAAHYLGIRLSKEEQKSDFTGKLRAEQIEYAARDAAILLLLRERLLKDIKEGSLIEVCKLEFDCVFAVAQMELEGIRIDSEKWQRLYKKYLEEQKIIALKLCRELEYGNVQMNLFGEEEIQGINLDSQAQIIKALKKKGIELNTTSHSELIAHKENCEAVALLLDYRRVSKAIQGFLSPIPQYINSATGRIHSSYRQIGAHSGRFSCGNPNIQQIPRGKEFRECFAPREGFKFIIADYSQIELRVAAEIAEDKTMIEAYRNGQDLHALTAALISGKNINEVSKAERQAAKAVNFGLIYAMGAKGLQGYAKTVYGIDMPLEEAETFRDRFFKAYKGIANWHGRLKKAVNVKESRTLSGRRCVYSGEPGITALLNTPVQGTAADITKKALGMLASRMKDLRGSIVATVHDEILLEVPEEMAKVAEEELKKAMESAGAYYLKKVPVVAETIIADSWAEK